MASNRISNLLRREADIALRTLRPEQASLTARKLGQIGIGAYAHERYLARAGLAGRAPRAAATCHWPARYRLSWIGRKPWRRLRAPRRSEMMAVPENSGAGGKSDAQGT